MEIQPTFNTWTTLFLVVAVHGIILAGLFYFRSTGRIKPNRLLGVFLFLFSVNLVSYVLYWTRYNIEFPHFVGIAGAFHFIYGPLILFYALSIVYPGRKWKAWDLAHAVPLVAFLIWNSSFYLQTSAQKVEIITAGYLNGPAAGLPTWVLIIVTIKVILMGGYGMAVLLLPRILKHWENVPLNRFSPENITWLRITGAAFLGFVLCYASYFILVETINFQIEHDYMISFAMSGFIFGIGYLGLFKPEFLEQAHNGKYKYENSSLSSSEADIYLEQLLEYMATEKPYLEGELKLNDLAGQLSIPPHHLSQIINEKLGKNFFEFVNSYRIKEAKEILSDPGKQDFKILRVAFESGFNNKTTFNTTFKTEVGTTPSLYRKEKLKKQMKTKNLI